jgi:hypothetical protein
VDDKSVFYARKCVGLMQKKIDFKLDLFYACVF